MGTKNMKLFLIAAVLIASVCAEPEADPKAWYSTYGAYGGYPYARSYGLGYAGYGGYGYAAAPYAATYSAAYARPYTTYAGLHAGYGLGYGHYLGKRSADSEPEAKPESWYGSYLPYGNGYA